MGIVTIASVAAGEALAADEIAASGCKRAE